MPFQPTGVLSADLSLNIHGVTWDVDWEIPHGRRSARRQIGAAIGKAGDYAAALGATVRQNRARS